MSEHIIIGLGSIIVLGILAQWLAWRLHLPAILLLLLTGFFAGPVFGLLHPDELFGDILFPIVSMSVAVILFEGGLSLHFQEVRKVGAVVTSLITIGALVTWVLSSFAAHLIVGLPLGPSLLIGAVLVVTGPTVIIPLLRQVRPLGRIGSVVKWEGIVNDPIGAIIAVIVFEVILEGGLREGIGIVIPAVLKAVFFGGGLGLFGAAIMVLLLRRYWVPDFLQNPISLVLVLLVFIAANAIQTESGLLAVTVMGIALANQRFVSVKHILEFKENLRVLLIAGLFVILSARLPIAELAPGSLANWVFVVVLIVLVRPVSVAAATFRSKLSRAEKLFVGWMAPRGIVAAAVTSVFVLRLSDAGHPQFEPLVPLIFQVIVGTVAVYGITAGPVARRLKISQPDPQGVLIAGAHAWARELGKLLNDLGIQAALVDSNWNNVTAARNLGLRAHYGSILAEDVLNELQLDGIGRLIAVTSNDEVNSLAALHFVELFGRSEVYQLPPSSTARKDRRNELPRHLRGRLLFTSEATYAVLSGRFQRGAVVKRTSITDEFNMDRLRSIYGSTVIPLFIVTSSGVLQMYTLDGKLAPRPGDTLVSIVDPRPEE
ncbi:MAG: cation:proton antiporter [candidate division Zixibacteria bacterium]|jgi:NhaP-type Na+/H+ or K+/H+ antiporter|nr:cation:proton antiporter [candidate division Zixibacteria bacterium]